MNPNSLVKTKIQISVLVVLFSVTYFSGCTEVKEKIDKTSEAVEVTAPGSMFEEDLTNQRLLMVPRSGGKLSVLTLKDLKLYEREINLPEASKAIFLPDPHNQLVLITSKSVSFFSIENNKVTRTVRLRNGFRNVSELDLFKREDELLIIDKKDKRLVSMDLNSGETTSDKRFEQQIIRFLPTATRGKVFIVTAKGDKGEISVFDEVINDITLKKEVSKPADGILTAYDQRLYLSVKKDLDSQDGNDQIAVYNAKDLLNLENIQMDLPVQQLVATPAGNKIYALSETGEVTFVINRFENKVIRKIKYTIPAEWMRVDESGRFLFVSHSDKQVVSIFSAGVDSLVKILKLDSPFETILTTPISSRVIVVRDGRKIIDVYSGDDFSHLKSLRFLEPMEFILGDMSVPYYAFGKEKEDGILPQAEETTAVGEQPSAAKVNPSLGSDGDYHLTIQILSTSSEIAADDEKRKMLELGYPAYTEKMDFGDRGTWYRVRVGCFRNHAEAKLVGDDIESRLKKDYWIDEGKPAPIKLPKISNRDMDADGHPEMVVVDAVGKGIYVFTIRDGRYHFRWKGNNLQGVRYGSRIVYQDVDSDGKMEAITQLLSPDGKQSVVGWESNGFRESIR